MATSGEKHGRRWGEPIAATGEKPMTVDSRSELLALVAPSS